MGKINNLQFNSILIVIILQSFFGLTGLNISSNDYWVSVLLGFLLGILIIALFIYIFSFKKELPIDKKIELLFGNKIGFLINIILIICYINISTILFYNLNTFINKEFLDKTPLYIIGFLFSLIIFYINTKGIETISRVSFLLLSLSFILIIISIISLFPSINIENFLPILNTKLNNIYMNSLPITMNIIPIFMLLMIPKNNIKNQNKSNKFIIISYILTLFIILSIIINIIGILGINLSKLYQYPEYIVLKRINIFNFINRIENILALQWIFEIFISISFITYYISKTISKKNNNYLYTIIILLPLIISLILFKNENDFIFYINYIIPAIKIIILSIFTLIGIKIVLFNQNNNNT